MIDPRFVFLAVAVDLIGSGAYAWGTLKGHTKPNRVTWILWTLIPLITFLAQLKQGVGLPAALTLAIVIGPLMVVIASFLNKDAYWKIGKFDWTCAGLAALAILLWILTKDALTAIILSLMADFIAGLPTLIKAYNFPETENAYAYGAGIISSGVTLLTIDNWNFATYGFPLYIFIVCVIIFILIKFPKIRPAHA